MFKKACKNSLCLVTVVLIGCDPAEPVDDPPVGARERALTAKLNLALPPLDPLQIVAYHSPIIYHDTHREGSFDGREYVHDYITKINFDHNYNGRDNAFSALSTHYNHPMPAHVYYSFSASSTHYFIGYYWFHAIDITPHPWPFGAGIDHENDFEGLILAVARPGASYGSGKTCTSSYGCLVAVVTQAHGKFYQYGDPTYGAQLSNGSDDVDAPIPSHYSSANNGYNGDGVSGRHPRVFVEANGHGVYSCGHSKASCGSAPGGNGIVYYRQTDGQADVPNPSSGGGGNYSRRYGYGLIALEASSGDLGPWHLRYHRNDNASKGCAASRTCLFNTWGGMNGDDGDDNAANMPWKWDDKDDGPTYAGDMLCDPAKLFDIIFDGPPLESNRFSHAYTHHPYWTHRIELSHIRPYRSSGGSYHVYYQVTASNQPKGTDVVFNDNHWRSSTHNWAYNYPRYGADQPAETSITYGDSSNEHYLCRPSRQAGAATAIRIRGKINSDSNQIWYYGAWMDAPGALISRSSHHGCQSYGCAYGGFELEANPENEVEAN